MNENSNLQSNVISERSLLNDKDKVPERKFKVKNTNSRAMNSRSIEIIKRSLINHQD